jgi:hypothetical protein
MSPREQTQVKIRDFLEEHGNYFNAPYGIIDSVDTFGKGKLRSITFGVSRYLDAYIAIYSPSKITVKCEGGLSYKFEGTYKSADELIAHFSANISK